MFNGAFHRYGCLVTPKWIVIYLDRKEVSRFPTFADAERPLFMRLTLAMQGRIRGEGNEPDTSVGGLRPRLRAAKVIAQSPGVLSSGPLGSPDARSYAGRRIAEPGRRSSPSAPRSLSFVNRKAARSRRIGLDASIWANAVLLADPYELLVLHAHIGATIRAVGLESCARTCGLRPSVHRARCKDAVAGIDWASDDVLEAHADDLCASVWPKSSCVRRLQYQRQALFKT